MEELAVSLGVLTPLLRHVIFIVDRFHRTDRYAGPAVDTLVGLDVEHSITLIDAVDGALCDTRFIFNINAWLGNHIGHDAPPSRSAEGRPCQVVAEAKAGAESWWE